jgi:hypothetical protein
VIEAQAEVELEISHRDRILGIEGVLVNVGGGVEIEQASTTSQIEWQNAWRKRRRCIGVVRSVGLKPAAAHWPGLVRGGIGNWRPGFINTGRVECRIGNAGCAFPAGPPM